MTGQSEWIGKVGQTWAAEWRHTDRAFAPLTRRLLATLDAIAPSTGRAFDIGCGAGETAIALARLRPELCITGADISGELIDVARERAKAISKVDFNIGDAAQSATAAAPIDLFLSRHGVMFFADPIAAFTAFHAAAAPGARLIFSCFRDWSLNRFASDIEPALGKTAPDPAQPGPFAFASAQRVLDLLAASGWRNARAESIDFSYVAGAGEDPVADAVRFLTRIGPAARALRDAQEAERCAILTALRGCCEARRNGGMVAFPAAAWVWTAEA